MPQIAASSPRTAYAAIALGLGLALGPGAALASPPEWMHPHHGDHMPGTWHDGHMPGDWPGVPSLDDEPSNAVVTSGSGALAAVQVCDHGVHVAVVAGGQGGERVLGIPCDHADHTAAMAVAGGGAIGLAMDGAALTAPAASAPTIPQVLALDAAMSAPAPAHGGGMMHGHGDMPMHMDMGMGMGMAMGNGQAGPGGRHVGRGGLYAMERGERMRGEGRVRGMKAVGGKEDRGGKGGKKARGGQVTAMPSTGAGMPLAPDPVMQSVLAAVASAVAGLAGFRRKAAGR